MIYIKLIDKYIFNVDVEENSSVLLLKRTIEEKFDIPICQQRLLYKGILLLDESILEKYELRENSVVHLVYQI